MALYFILYSLCLAKVNSNPPYHVIKEKEITPTSNTTFMAQNGITVTSLPYQYPVTSSMYNGQHYWNISTNTQAGYALKISLDNSWGFDPTYYSILSVTINGTSQWEETGADLDIFVALSVGSSEYISTYIRMDNAQDYNMIYPFCSTIPSIARQFAQGDIQSIAAANVTGLRDQNVMITLSIENDGNYGYVMQGHYPSTDHLNSWPITFSLANDPDSDVVYFQYSSLEWWDLYKDSDRYSQCIYQALNTNQGLDIFIAGDDNGETFGISSISLQYAMYSPTQQPTTSPTTDPTTNPIKPTTSPSKYPSISPTENPTNSPIIEPSESPAVNPSNAPSKSPSYSPNEPTASSANANDSPSESPTMEYTKMPSIATLDEISTLYPSAAPTMAISHNMSSNTKIIFILCVSILFLVGFGICWYVRFRVKKSTGDAHNYLEMKSIEHEGRGSFQDQVKDDVQDEDDIKSLHVIDTAQHADRHQHRIQENKEDDLIHGLHRDTYSDPMNEQRNNDFTSWDCNEILEWILSLEQGLFVEYKEIMMSNMKEKGVIGSDLMRIEMEDIRNWGD